MTAIRRTLESLQGVISREETRKHTQKYQSPQLELSQKAAYSYRQAHCLLSNHSFNRCGKTFADKFQEHLKAEKRSIYSSTRHVPKLTSRTQGRLRALDPSIDTFFKKVLGHIDSAFPESKQYS